MENSQQQVSSPSPHSHRRRLSLSPGRLTQLCKSPGSNKSPGSVSSWKPGQRISRRSSVGTASTAPSSRRSSASVASSNSARSYLRRRSTEGIGISGPLPLLDYLNSYHSRDNSESEEVSRKSASSKTKRRSSSSKESSSSKSVVSSESKNKKKTKKTPMHTSTSSISEHLAIVMGDEAGNVESNNKTKDSRTTKDSKKKKKKKKKKTEEAKPSSSRKSQDSGMEPTSPSKRASLNRLIKITGTQPSLDSSTRTTGGIVTPSTKKDKEKRSSSLGPIGVKKVEKRRSTSTGIPGEKKKEKRRPSFPGVLGEKKEKTRSSLSSLEASNSKDNASTPRRRSLPVSTAANFGIIATEDPDSPSARRRRSLVQRLGKMGVSAKAIPLTGEGIQSSLSCSERSEKEVDMQNGKKEALNDHEARIRALEQENNKLVQRLMKEYGRSQKLRKQIHDLKQEKDDSSNRSSLLIQKDDLFELDSTLHTEASAKTHTSSVISVVSSWDGADGVIANRLQRQLNETREALAEKEKLLSNESANLALQTQRVQELEHEVANKDGLQQKCKKLEEERDQLAEKLKLEQESSEQRLQQKEESVNYFQKEVVRLSAELEKFRRKQPNRKTESMSFGVMRTRSP